MSDLAFAGYKSFLRAKGLNRAQLLTLAAEVEAGIEETILTSLSADGTGTGAQVSDLPKTLRLAAIMEVYEEGPNGRQLFAIADRSRYGTAV